jgi:hypothetical protein
MNIRFAGGVLALAVCLAAACGSDTSRDDDDGASGQFGGYTVRDYCDDLCSCVGCTEAERSDCVDSGEDNVDAARDDGCDSQVDDYLNCVGEEVMCVEGEFDNDGCEEEVGDLVACTNSGQGGGGG